MCSHAASALRSCDASQMLVKCTDNLQHASQKTQTFTQTPPADYTHAFSSQTVCNSANLAEDDEDSAIIDAAVGVTKHVPTKGTCVQRSIPSHHRPRRAIQIGVEHVMELTTRTRTCLATMHQQLHDVATTEAQPSAERSSQSQHAQRGDSTGLKLAMQSNGGDPQPAALRCKLGYGIWPSNANRVTQNGVILSVTLARMSAILSYAYDALTS